MYSIFEISANYVFGTKEIRNLSAHEKCNLTLSGDPLIHLPEVNPLHVSGEENPLTSEERN